MRPIMQAAVLSIGLFFAQATPSYAGIPTPVEMTCPVGGKKFTFISTMSYSNWGSRPDGKPYGSWTFPMPVPDCPDNGLVLYKKFSDEEIKQLKLLLKTPGFQRVRYETRLHQQAGQKSASDQMPIYRILPLQRGSHPQKVARGQNRDPKTIHTFIWRHAANESA
jgi:hypothetical protein